MKVNNLLSNWIEEWKGPEFQLAYFFINPLPKERTKQFTAFWQIAGYRGGRFFKWEYRIYPKTEDIYFCIFIDEYAVQVAKKELNDFQKLFGEVNLFTWDELIEMSST